jgi:hypothetical protein
VCICCDICLPTYLPTCDLPYGTTFGKLLSAARSWSLELVKASLDSSRRDDGERVGFSYATRAKHTFLRLLSP